MKKIVFPIIFGSACLCASSAFGVNVLHGNVFEFTSPDQLLLDSGSAVIAVDTFGDADRVVNGVTFQTDAARAPITESVINGGVTVVTARAAAGGGEIDGWAAAPLFTGADATSATNLGLIMQDIRWSLAPDGTTVDVTGLNSGTIYDVQLLFNEGADRDRRWDIGVDGVLVVDDMSSEGEGIWSPENSFAYQGRFDPGADGALNILLQQHIGGEDPMGLDNNPILQAVIIHQIPEPSVTTLIAAMAAVLGVFVGRRRRRA